MHPIVRITLETLGTLIALLVVGMAFGTFVCYFMLWICG